ncbi:MAG: hypothetical protein KDD63_02620 [Bacteroidetes bacterium]|nr:hypothetical protein [Bacteroidota bacterium]MCB0843014.1 hypothetical protein [Bacteroidota bacterium]MCB0851111.1 hypothetical protein [Bacteroidota bacterium]
MLNNYFSVIYPLLIAVFFFFNYSSTTAQTHKPGFILTSESGIVYGSFQEASGLPDLQGQTFIKTNHLQNHHYLVLKKGEFTNRKLYNWYQNTRMGRVIPRNLILSQVDTSGKLVRSWILIEVHPGSESDFQMNHDGTGQASYLKYRCKQVVPRIP